MKNTNLLMNVPAADQFDIAKCITSILWTSIIHGDDVLDHASVELSEAWLREYQCVSPSVFFLFFPSFLVSVLFCYFVILTS